MEIVPDDVNLNDLRDEVNLRTYHAGYTTKEGNPIPKKIQTTISWGRSKLNLWPRDKHGNLIDD
jgi:hypothetical protein